MARCENPVEHQAPAQNDRYVLRLPSNPNPTVTSVCNNWGRLMRGVPIQPPTPYAFLQDLDLATMVANGVEPMVRWTYESRWQAQEILPFLYLGPISACKNIDFLRTANVSMVVAVRQADRMTARPPSLALQAAQAAGIDMHMLDVTSSQQLFSTLVPTISVINDHLSTLPATTPRAVMICCDTGNSRSAALAIAYCMQTLGLELEWAWRIVNNSRYCTCLDDSLKAMLGTFADILQAQRDVRGVGDAADSRSYHSESKKRARSSDDSGHAELDTLLDYEHVDNSSTGDMRAFAPFSDDGEHD